MFARKTESDILALSPYLEIRRSARARRLALRVDAPGRKVRLVIPARMPLYKAYDFAEKHREWIEDKIQDVPPPVPFAAGTVLPILGRPLKIDVQKAAMISKITLTDTALLVPPGRASIETRIRRFLGEEARRTLTALAQEKAAAIGKPLKSVQIRDTKSRWGSCSADGRVCFSWRLIFAPWESLDYVVAHEVAHLVHMNHGPKFWALCAELSTDYAKGKQWIKAHGADLLRYGEKSPAPAGSVY
ncbi:MAG: M48 family metallopeptidase [Alphaproteobacteria bacterium]|nr:M48 family metallopeptidase [Alphaproteobacteria bacterium]